MKRLRAGSWLLGWLVLGSVAWAQSDRTYQLDDITVTAERLEDERQRVPGSIDAFTSEALEQTSIYQTDALAFRIPGMVYKSITMAGQVYIRGIGNDWLSIGVDPSVATLVDGVYQARAAGAFQDLYDVERVEVLKGPQGTLFGRNTTGGVVHIIHKEPTPEFEAQIDGLYGSFDHRRVRTLINVPVLKDQLFIRLASVGSWRDGYTENIFLDTDLNDEDRWSLRGQVLLYATDQLDILLSGDVLRERDTRSVGPHPDPDCCVNLGLQMGGIVPDDPREVSADVDSNERLDAWGLKAKVVLDLEAQEDWLPASLTSVSAYRSTELFFKIDLDQTNIAIGSNAAREDSEVFTQELQLASETGGRVEWVTGAYYLREEASQFFDVEFSLFQARNQPGGRILTQAWAVFGHISYALMPQLRFSTGLRYSHESKRFRFQQMVADPTGQLTGQPGTQDLRQAETESWEALTPKFSLEYLPREHLLLYTTISRGFKAGGFNTAQFQSGFDPEFVWAYEVGLKSTWLDQRLRINIAGFYYDYDDLQILTLPVGALPGTGPTISNAAEATIKGLELEVVAQPLTPLTLEVKLAALDARFDSFTALDPNNPLADPDRSGKRLAHAPKFSLYAGAQYQFSLWQYGQLTIRGDYRYQSQMFFSSFQDPFVEQEGHGIVNARLQFDSADTHWSMALFGTNLTDQLYAQNKFRQDPTTGTIRFWGPPRSVGFQVAYRY